MLLPADVAQALDDPNECCLIFVLIIALADDVFDVNGAHHVDESGNNVLTHETFLCLPPGGKKLY